MSQVVYIGCSLIVLDIYTHIAVNIYMDHNYYVYILTNRCGGALYIGVTNDLTYRVWQHKNKKCSGFTAKYDINRLVYYEYYLHVDDAINREKQLKNWKRQWKINLFQESNPDWIDLYPGLMEQYHDFGHGVEFE